MNNTPIDEFALLQNITVETLNGVNKSQLKRLHKLGLYTVLDVLFHFPLRYEDRTSKKHINQLIDGEQCNVVGTVVNATTQQAPRRMLLVTIEDHTGQMTMKFFRFSPSLQSFFSPGRIFNFFGKFKCSRFGHEMIHPEYSVYHREEQSDKHRYFTPIYPSTDGLKQFTLLNIIEQSLQLLHERVGNNDIYPKTLNTENISINDALTLIHYPPIGTNLGLLSQYQHPAQLRLIKEELLTYHLSSLILKSLSKKDQATVYNKHDKLLRQFLAQLDFSLTKAQVRVLKDIQTDLSVPHPMLRLVQGDVGSGKTVVAAMSALMVIATKGQVALMAPTEILAEQHYLCFKAWFEPLGINVDFLIGKTTKKARKKILTALATGETQIIIGTQALFQDEVVYHDLGLVIIDEQHRFGVHQRLSLRDKGANNHVVPHQLVMTATPIPRTLAMVKYAEMDTSVIDELPPGRTPIKTVCIPDVRRHEIIDRIRHICLDEKRQVYWVCTLIEESEILTCQAAEAIAEHLAKELPELHIGLIHGRLKPKEKQAIMEKFANNELHLLVATTVIEVGVNVPNASLMVIENPERLGLAQLHQLRGRVGRGSAASFCVLLYGTPITPIANERLAVLRNTNDGFVVAEKDMILRGAGDILGTKQAGTADFRIADIVRDQGFLNGIKKHALWLLVNQPDIAPLFIERWLPNKSQYKDA